MDLVYQFRATIPSQCYPLWVSFFGALPQRVSRSAPKTRGLDTLLPAPAPVPALSMTMSGSWPRSLSRLYCEPRPSNMASRCQY